MKSAKFLKVLVNRIISWMDNNPESALTANQFGFRRGRSTIDALTEVKKFIEFTLRDDGVALAVSLDIANAFNSLQWGDIRRALREKRIPEYICRVIDSYLSNRYIEYPSARGMVRRTMEAGVPQGSVLGPLLWNITYDQVLRVTTEEGCHILGYADDTLILVAAEDGEAARLRAEVQTAITIRKIKTLSLKVAAEKTEIVAFRKRRSPEMELTLEIEDKHIRSKQEMKYLGIIVDSELSFMKHLKYTQEKVNRTNGALCKIMPNLRGPDETRRKLYAYVVTSIVMYGAPVWAEEITTKKEALRILRHMQKRIALRVISAYRTVSYDAATIIARMPPYHLTAMLRCRTYQRVSSAKLNNSWDRGTEKQIFEEENARLRADWKLFAERIQASGNFTRNIILPEWNRWLDRKHGSVNFRLTQALTGHGVFNYDIS